MGTAPIENVINTHHLIVESAVVGFPHEIKGNALYAFVICNKPIDDEKKLANEITELISTTIGPIAKPDRIQVVSGLPKTRSGKIMRRILRKLAKGKYEKIGDTSTLLNPNIVKEIKKKLV